MTKKKLKPVVALGASFLATSVVPVAMADGNPFAVTELSRGYQLAEEQGEGKCGEAKCGAQTPEEKSGAEGNCGGEQKTDGEGKCGEGKCGGGA